MMIDEARALDGPVKHHNEHLSHQAGTARREARGARREARGARREARGARDLPALQNGIKPQQARPDSLCLSPLLRPHSA
ncbi:hypothetical protein ACFSDD_05735 [Salipiger marinus]|uniref:hypothetical protein n=1 Tax=Salipiger marinus TaxID=555512 RepID=UPI002C8381E2|nr:hypothetical protein [Salipiger manganoxidans]MEB3418054.1 hypothetical protein [Salipiger manganoxidans]